MEEIKVGDYIRTPSGDIGTVTNTELMGPEIFTGTKYLVLAPEGIKNHSPNIIDLIEKDDYINGCRVYKVEEHGVTVYQQTEDGVIDYNWICRSDIKSIVTHEQFNSIKYEV